MRLLVAIPDPEREAYGLQERLLPLDFDQILKLPYDEIVALEDTMQGAPSLALLRLQHLPEYSAKALRSVAFLALRQAGKTPVWADFKPNTFECFYVIDGDDVGPPGQGSGDSFETEPAPTS